MSHAVDTERFPTFPPEYRQRWIDAGLWLNRTLHGVFDDVASRHGEDVALIDGDARETFGQFKANADALAAGLVARGIGVGSLVSVQLPNWREFAYLQIALSRIGAVMHPVHLVYREREMQQLFSFCESDAVVVPEEYKDFPYLETVRSLRSNLPSLQQVIVARGEAEGEAESTIDGLIADGRQHLDLLEDVESDPDQVFYLNFTSGTEGDPKGFMHTHNSLISMMVMMVQMMQLEEQGAVVLTCSPMSHSFGHFMTYYSELGGVPIVLVDRYNPTRVLQLIEDEQVTHLSGTPAHLWGILDYEKFADFDTNSIQNVMAGGAQSSPKLLDALAREWNIHTNNTYGLGENVVHTQTNPNDPPEKARTSVGRPLPGREVKIVNPETREEVPVGEVGEIAFRGPTLCVGYYKQPELTAETRDGEGWFYTGDLGQLDNEGYLYFVGRHKEVINRGGSKIYPKEIEDLVSSMEGIVDVAVVPIPDKRLGERVGIAVTTRADQTISLADIRHHLEEQKVMEYKLPEEFRVLKGMPMTPTGKVRKVEIRDEWAKEFPTD